MFNNFISVVLVFVMFVVEENYVYYGENEPACTLWM